MERQAVDQHVFRRRPQPGQGEVHGAMGRAQDIDLIDQGSVDLRDGIMDFRARGQFREEELARGGRQLLGIVDLLQRLGQAVANPVGGEDDGGGEDRSRQRPAAGFIHAGDAGHAAFEQFEFVLKEAGNHFRHDGLL